jgi:hypothetical protein
MTIERDRGEDRAPDDPRPDRDDDRVLDDMDYIQPVGGVGGVMVPPAENSLFNPAPEIDETEQDTSDEYVVPEDRELAENPGASPEFDHSLRRHKKPE